MGFEFFNKKSASLADKSVSGSGVAMLQYEELAEELHKLIIKTFLERTVSSSFKDNIWGADLADMQLISKSNNGVRFLLCVVDIFSKYAWVIRKNISACLFNVHNTISLSRHEQVCLMRLRFERYFRLDSPK